MWKIIPKIFTSIGTKKNRILLIFYFTSLYQPLNSVLRGLTFVTSRSTSNLSPQHFFNTKNAFFMQVFYCV